MNSRPLLRWIPPAEPDETACRQLARELGLAPFAATILCNRGFGQVDVASDFLDPRLRSLADPFLLPNMERAAERILRAIDQREQIVLFGDYDVDGVTSLALLTRLLRAYGVETGCFLPNRMEEGYGLSRAALDRCLLAHVPELLIAVDCGTSSVAEIAALSARGVEVVVLDHHECQAALPECVALVNPKLGETGQDLCSVGIAFKMAHALLKRRSIPGFDLRHQLDLVALGTVADLVPLCHENRILVKRGLQQLEQTRCPGIRALIEVSGVRVPLTCRDVAFALAPRLNAAGRLGTALEALELLLTDDPERARQLAASLDRQNRERRAVEDTVFAEAEEQLLASFDPSRDAAIVVGAPEWHAGVVGIVASRLLKRYHRPTFVIAFDACGIGKGSGRSIPGFSLVAALEPCARLLEKFGGHEMAAGLTMDRRRYEEFRQEFARCAGAILTAEDLQPSLQIDGEIALADLDFNFLQTQERLAPFGIGNPHPLFVARAVTAAAAPRVVKEKHLGLTLRQDGAQRHAILFGGAAEPLPPPPWDVAFHVERNEYQERISAQVEIKAIRSSIGSAA